MVLYSVWCYCYSQKNTGLASIGEILVCAPVAMLDHMNLLLDPAVTDQNGISSMPLFFQVTTHLKDQQSTKHPLTKSG